MNNISNCNAISVNLHAHSLLCHIIYCFNDILDFSVYTITFSPLFINTLPPDKHLKYFPFSINCFLSSLFPLIIHLFPNLLLFFFSPFSFTFNFSLLSFTFFPLFYFLSPFICQSSLSNFIFLFILISYFLFLYLLMPPNLFFLFTYLPFISPLSVKCFSIDKSSIIYQLKIC